MTIGAQHILASGYTQLTLKDFIKARWVDAGFTVVDDYISGADLLFVVSFFYASAQGAKNTVFLRIRVTAANGISYRIADGYNSGTKTLSNDGGADYGGFTPTAGQDFRARTEISADDWRAVTFRSGAGVGISARQVALRAAHLTDTWNENVALAAFAMNGVNNAILHPPSNAFAMTGMNVSNSFSLFAALNSRDLTATGARDVRSGLWVGGTGGFAGGRYTHGVCIDDMSVCYASGLNIYDSFTGSDGNNRIVLTNAMFESSVGGIVWRTA